MTDPKPITSVNIHRLNHMSSHYAVFLRAIQQIRSVYFINKIREIEKFYKHWLIVLRYVRTKNIVCSVVILKSTLIYTLFTGGGEEFIHALCKYTQEWFANTNADEYSRMVKGIYIQHTWVLRSPSSMSLWRFYPSMWNFQIAGPLLVYLFPSDFYSIWNFGFLGSLLHNMQDRFNVWEKMPVRLGCGDYNTF